MVKKSAVATVKSPAEFFAENQNIAGFDNPGKSLYTTIRELVENALDAAESIRVFPDIELTVRELSPEAIAELRGIQVGQRSEHKGSTTGKKKSKKKKAGGGDNEEGEGTGEEVDNIVEKGDKFFKISCRDNGCGMLHDEIPNMFGRVLAGSKYGVKQARGKFGLGAKMALIWSKKSTGLPIEITSAHSTNKADAPSKETFCRLDIDVHKNEPKIHIHEKRPNKSGWRGTQVDVIIGGAWSSYRARIMSYMQMLAVITPYARFKFRYVHDVKPKNSFAVEYERRSNVICEPSKEVNYHPKSVDNLIMRQLITRTRKGTKLSTFLTKHLACINKPMANSLVNDLVKITKGKFDADECCKDISDQDLQQLTQLLRETKFPSPRADCLSPAGEYNLHLGILKEYSPQLVATACSKPGVYNGHPFIVETAIALGAPEAKPGITVYRFANRIPLLFEPGSDVVTIVANKRIKWASYMINQKVDKIGVFVSIVSTKIPFKGTGKEYIGEHVEEIRKMVLNTMRQCASQLKKKVAEKRSANQAANRLKSLTKYIPNVSSALMKVVEEMKDAEKESNKRRKLEEKEDEYMLSNAAALEELREIERTLLGGNSVTEKVLVEHLETHVHNSDMAEALETAKKRGRGQASLATFYLVPTKSDQVKMAKPITNHPLIAFRFFASAETAK